MPLLKHPTSGSIINVTGARATVLKARGYTEVDDYEYPSEPPSAVQPQPPIDARAKPPEPPVEARPSELFADQPLDTRPPNPASPVANSVAEADASLPNPEPQPELDAEPEPEPQSELDAEPEPEPQSELDAEPEPQPEPEMDAEPIALERPAASAPKAAWVAYATQQGVQDADDLSKPALIELLDA